MANARYPAELIDFCVDQLAATQNRPTYGMARAHLLTALAEHLTARNPVDEFAIDERDPSRVLKIAALGVDGGLDWQTAFAVGPDGEGSARYVWSLTRSGVDDPGKLFRPFASRGDAVAAGRKATRAQSLWTMEVRDGQVVRVVEHPRGQGYHETITSALGAAGARVALMGDSPDVIKTPRGGQGMHLAETWLTSAGHKPRDAVIGSAVDCWLLTGSFGAGVLHELVDRDDRVTVIQLDGDRYYQNVREVFP